MKFLVYVLYLEIYNEEIRDFFGKDYKFKLELKEYFERGVYVKDFIMYFVYSVFEMEKVMDFGSKNWLVGVIFMNVDLLRLYLIFTINIEIMEIVDESGEYIRVGKFNFVDLVGSER